MDHMSPEGSRAADLQFGAGPRQVAASIPHSFGSLTVSAGTWFNSAQSWERKVCLLRSTVLAVLLGTTVVGSAAAEDCFPKIRAAEARMAAPHRPAPAHKTTINRDKLRMDRSSCRPAGSGGLLASAPATIRAWLQQRTCHRADARDIACHRDISVARANPRVHMATCTTSRP